MITLYKIDCMQDVPNYDNDPTTYYQKVVDTYYVWVPTDEEEQFHEYYADPDYVVKEMMKVPSVRDIELIEIACNEINERER